MPRQNRVTPFGAVIATPARGLFMGNRGCLHDDRQQLRRGYAGTRWIMCELAFKGRKLPLMDGGHNTQLFFLDEPTALAAGHRPCAECMRTRFNRFRAAWAAANPQIVSASAPLVSELDAALHRERIGPRGAKLLHQAALDDLPDGAMIVLDELPFLALGDTLRAWSPFGYGPALARPAGVTVDVLTPRSIVRTLAQGYPLTLHPSAGAG
jgi:hypothetical protein